MEQLKVVNNDIRTGFLSLGSVNHSWVLHELSYHEDYQDDEDYDYYYNFDKDLTDEENYKLVKIYNEFSVNLDSFICKGWFFKIKQLYSDMFDSVKELYYVSK